MLRYAVIFFIIAIIAAFFGFGGIATGAAIIYHDLSFNFFDEGKSKGGQFWLVTTPEGKKTSKMSIGMAIVYLPFFLIAHTIASLNPGTFPPVGYGPVYDLLLILGDILFTCLGLFYLRKILLRFEVGEVIIAITIGILYYGTNMMFYSVFEVMPHNFLFCLLTIYFWQVIIWHERRNFSTSFWMGLNSGLIIIIRPVDALIVVLFFTFYNVKNLKSFLDKWKLIFSDFKYIAIIKLAALSVLMVQLLYWKTYTGHWLYYSYGDEKFFFNHPHIIEGLFSYRKGWFLYSPLMIVAVTGILFPEKRFKAFSLASPLTWMIFTYVIFCWWCWWYGGGFSTRPMIDIYGLMGIGLAGILLRIQNMQNTKLRFSSFALVALLTCYSIYRTYQYHISVVHFDSMTATTFKISLFHLKPFPGKEYHSHMRKPDYEGAKKNGKEN